MKIKQALEECASCNASGDGDIVDPWKGKRDPKDNTDTKVPFDDGKGIKDTVMISGPLSHAYTQALLLTLKKEPLQEDDKETIAEENPSIQREIDPMIQKNPVESIGVAQEGTQADEVPELMMLQNLEDVSKADIEFAADNFDFIMPNEMPINVVCNTTLISMVDLVKAPTIISLVENDKNKNYLDNVIVVVDATSDKPGNNNFKIHSGLIYDSNLEEQQLLAFNAAIENHIEPAGYKVILGMEDYFKYLRKLRKSLGR